MGIFISDIVVPDRFETFMENLFWKTGNDAFDEMIARAVAKKVRRFEKNDPSRDWSPFAIKMLLEGAEQFPLIPE